MTDLDVADHMAAQEYQRVNQQRVNDAILSDPQGAIAVASRMTAWANVAPTLPAGILSALAKSEVMPDSPAGSWLIRQAVPRLVTEPANEADAQTKDRLSSFISDPTVLPQLKQMPIAEQTKLLSEASPEKLASLEPSQLSHVFATGALPVHHSWWNKAGDWATTGIRDVGAVAQGGMEFLQAGIRGEVAGIVHTGHDISHGFALQPGQGAFDKPTYPAEDLKIPGLNIDLGTIGKVGTFEGAMEAQHGFKLPSVSPGTTDLHIASSADMPSLTDQTTIGQAIFHGRSLGGGFTVEGTPANQAAVEAQKAAATVDGHALTPGRALASFVFQPGSQAYHLASGTIDFQVAMKGDITVALLDEVSGLRSAKRIFAPTSEEAIRRAASAIVDTDKTVDLTTIRNWTGQTREATPELTQAIANKLHENPGSLSTLLDTGVVDPRAVMRKIGQPEIGAFSGLRQWVHQPQAMTYLAGDRGQELVDKIANTSSYMDLHHAFNGGAPADLIARLAEESDPNAIRTILGTELGASVKNTPHFGFDWTHKFDTKRWSNFMPNGSVSHRNPTTAVEQAMRQMAEIGVPREKWDDVLMQIAKADDQGKFGDAYIHNLGNVMADTLVEKTGISRTDARRITKFFPNSVAGDAGFYVDEVGNTPYVAGLVVGGEAIPLSGPHLGAELVDTVPVLDARTLRRAASSWRKIEAMQQSELGLARGAAKGIKLADYLASGYTDAWKAGKLLRLGLPIRILAEAQARIALSGLSSIGSRPLDAIAITLGDRLGTDLTGKPFIEMLGDRSADYVRGIGASSWINGRSVFDAEASLGAQWSRIKRGDMGFETWWADEISTLHADALGQQVGRAIEDPMYIPGEAKIAIPEGFSPEEAARYRAGARAGRAAGVPGQPPIPPSPMMAWWEHRPDWVETPEGFVAQVPEKAYGELVDQATELQRRQATRSARAAERAQRGRPTGLDAISSRIEQEINRRGPELGLSRVELDEVRYVARTIGEGLFDDVGLSIKTSKAGSRTLGQYDWNNGLVTIFTDAIKGRGMNRTLLHELWHHLSSYIPEEAIASVEREMMNARKVFTREHPWAARLGEDWGRGISNEEFERRFVEIPGSTEGPTEDVKNFFTRKDGKWYLQPNDQTYRLTNTDEWFAETMYDLTAKRIDLAGKSSLWTVAQRALAKMWDGMQRVFGRDSTRAMFEDFWKGRYAEGKVRDHYPMFTTDEELARTGKEVRYLEGEPAAAEGVPAETGAALRTGKDAIKDWYYDGPGKFHRQKLIDANLKDIHGNAWSKNLEQRVHSDAYVDSVFDRVLTKTGNGDSELVDAVANGTPFKGNSPNGNFVERLGELSQQGVGPDVVKGIPKAGTPRWRNPKVIANAVDRFFQVLVESPYRALAKDPVYRQSYWKEGERLLPFANREAQATIIENAAKAGVTLTLPEESGRLTVQEAHQLSNMTALRDAQNMLHYVSERNNMADTLRYIAPFGDAWRNIVTQWSKIALAEPRVFRRVQQGVTEARRSGFFHKDASGVEKFTMLPGAANKAIVGVDWPLEADVRGLNIAASGLPGVGPAVIIGADKILPKHGIFEGVRNYLMPYGAPDLAGGTVETLFPGWIDRLRTSGWFDGIPGLSPSGQDRVTLSHLADNVFSYHVAAEHLNFDGPDGLERMHALVDQSMHEAQKLYVQRGLASAAAPAAVDYNQRVKLPVPAVFTVGTPKGQISAGNIDLTKRPVVKNKDGTVSTVRSITITDDQNRAILIPTVVDGKVVSNDEAIAHYRDTHETLGTFDTEAHANTYAAELHKQQASLAHGGIKDGQWIEIHQLASEYADQVRATGDTYTATLNMLSLYGPDVIFAMSPKTRDKYGIPTTAQAAVWSDNHPGLIDKYRDVIRYWVPSTGEGDYSEYLDAIQSGKRESPDTMEWALLGQARLGNAIYANLRSQLGNKPDVGQRNWLADAKAKITQKFPGFGMDSLKGSHNTLDQDVDILRQAVRDPQLSNESVSHAITVYIGLRDQALASARQATGLQTTTLAGERMAPLRDWLYQSGAAISAHIPEFTTIWDDLFSREVDPNG